MAKPATPSRPIEVSLAALLLALATQSLVNGGSVPWTLVAVLAGPFWAAVAGSPWRLDPVAHTSALVPSYLVGVLAAGRLLTRPPPLNGTRVAFLLFSLAVIICLSTRRAREALRRSRLAP